MERAHLTVPKLQETLQSFRDHRRLTSIVRSMAREFILQPSYERVEAERWREISAE